MKVVNARPPLYEEIAAVFDLAGCRPIFAWGDTIYNPHAVAIGPELLAHERVHGERQLRYGGVAMWWKRYMEDAQFRLDEELVAHRAEYHAHCQRGGVTRNQRRVLLRHVARKLAARLYGSLISVDDAKIAIDDPEFAPVVRTTASAARHASASHPLTN